MCARIETETAHAAIIDLKRQNGLKILAFVFDDAGVRKTARLRMVREASRDERRTASVQAANENEAMPRHRAVQAAKRAIFAITSSASAAISRTISPAGFTSWMLPAPCPIANAERSRSRPSTCPPIPPITPA